MLPELQKVKGMHPGVILEQEFRERGIKKSAFALNIGVYPGILSDITRQRRGVNARLALKLEKALGMEEGYLMVMQAYYAIGLEKSRLSRQESKPDLSIIPIWLFWDIQFDKLDFKKSKRFVIERIFERGNHEQIMEIIQFYGWVECRRLLRGIRNTLYSTRYNALKYLDLNMED